GSVAGDCGRVDPAHIPQLVPPPIPVHLRHVPVRTGPPGMRLDSLIGTREQAQFAADVREALTRHPRQLPSQYLYDGLGSALFDAICQLPWYGVTRAEHRLLARDAGRILTSDCRMLVELGPGNGSKLASLLSTVCPDGRPLTVHLVDVSRAALRQATRALEQFRSVSVVQHAAN